MLHSRHLGNKIALQCGHPQKACILDILGMRCDWTQDTGQCLPQYKSSITIKLQNEILTNSWRKQQCQESEHYQDYLDRIIL